MTESELQTQICKLLDALGIVYFRSRMDKRTTNAPGTPDFLFCVRQPPRFWLNDISPSAWEVKLPKKKLHPEQEKMRDRMTKRPNAWRHAVITSIQEAENELRQMGLIS